MKKEISEESLCRSHRKRERKKIFLLLQKDVFALGKCFKLLRLFFYKGRDCVKNCKRKAIHSALKKISVFLPVLQLEKTGQWMMRQVNVPKRLVIYCNFAVQYSFQQFLPQKHMHTGICKVKFYIR